MTAIQERLHSVIDKYEAKDFSFFFKSLDGLSEEMLNQHHTLYEGYIKKVNEILEKFKTVDKTGANHNFSEFRALETELSHNLNGVILHELYFSNLIDKKTQPSDVLKSVIERDFGNWDNYIENIKAAGKSARNGWAITAYNYRDGKIHNFAIDLHDTHVPISVKPLLVLDTWEHAYTLDYGINKPEYINAFFKNVNWPVVSQRFESAQSMNQYHATE